MQSTVSTTQSFKTAQVASYLFAVFAVAILSGLSHSFVPLAFVVAAAVLVFSWRRPVIVLGIILAALPFLPLPTLAAAAAGVPNVELMSAFKEIGILICAISLAVRRGYRWTLADTLLLALTLLVSFSVALGGDARGVKDDLDFVLAFFAGRVLTLDPNRELRWVKIALVLLSVLAVGGLIEAFVLGPAPRTLLMGFADPNELPVSFRASFYSGFRPGSFTSSPLSFGPFCMIGVVLLLIYGRTLSRRWWLTLVPIAAGLIASLTRGAWLGVAVGAALVAWRTGRKAEIVKLLAATAVVALALLPLLNAGEFIGATKSGEDNSLQVHRSEIFEAIEQIKPFSGTGAGSVGPRAIARSGTATNIDGGYIIFGLEYGLLAAVLLLLFYLNCLSRCARDSSALGTLAVCMIVITAILQVFMVVSVDFNLSAWMLLPVGMAYTNAQGRLWRPAWSG